MSERTRSSDRKSGIEWTKRTWQTVAGCQKISAGCTNCYAIYEALRRQGREAKNRIVDPSIPIVYGDVVDSSKKNWTGVVRCIPGSLGIPYEWNDPGAVFVNSEADTFHEDVPDQWIKRMFAVMGDSMLRPWWFQLLTKRSERLCELGPSLSWAPNIWPGVTVDNEKALGRIDDLRACGAEHRWLSIEPLLGPLPGLDLTNIDWVVVGGESKNSGDKSRAMKIEWVREIRDKCKEAGIPMFFKQWGHDSYNPMMIDGSVDPTAVGKGKAKGGATLDGEIVQQVPGEYEHFFETRQNKVSA